MVYVGGRREEEILIKLMYLIARVLRFKLSVSNSAMNCS